MANNLVVGDILEIIICGNLPPQASETVLHAQLTSITAGVPTDFDCANGLDNSFATIFKPLWPVQITYRGTSVRRLNQHPPLPAAAYTGNAGACSAAGLVNAGQVRGLIKWQTAFAGRAYRGRSYIPWVGVNDVASGGIATPGYVTAILTFATMWGTGAIIITVGGKVFTIVPGIYHRKTAKAGLPLAGTITPIVSAAAGNSFATQRKSGSFGRTNNPPF